jgi:hypothetical protein
MNKFPMNNPGEQDWLDKVLSEDTGYITDEGFTERVMSRLPAPRQSNRLYTLIFGCAALFSMACFLLSAPGLTSLYIQCLVFLQTQPLYNLSALTLTIYAATSALTWWLINPD